MLSFGPNFDYTQEFVQNWDKKLHALRLASFVISILMILFGILCMIFPVKSALLLEYIAVFCILAAGIYMLVDYFKMPVYLRSGGVLATSILNILLSVILLCSPTEATLSTFAFVFGILMLVFGINEIALTQKLCCFSVTGYGWVTASGILNILAAALFLLAPLWSAVFMSYALAVYLLVGGISLLLEAVSMKDLQA